MNRASRLSAWLIPIVGGVWWSSGCGGAPGSSGQPVTLVYWVCSEASCGSRAGESTLVFSSDGRAKLTLRGLDEMTVLSGTWSGDEWLRPRVRWARVHIMQSRAHESGSRGSRSDATPKDDLSQRARFRWRAEKRTTSAVMSGKPTGDGGVETSIEAVDWPSRRGIPRVHRWILATIRTLPPAKARGHLELP